MNSRLTVDCLLACRAGQRKPKRVAALAAQRIVQVAIGGWHCLAVNDEGQVGLLHCRASICCLKLGLMQSASMQCSSQVHCCCD